jgi:hypothetical protein
MNPGSARLALHKEQCRKPAIAGATQPREQD